MLIKSKQWLRRPTTLCLTRALRLALQLETDRRITPCRLTQHRSGYSTQVRTSLFENTFDDDFDTSSCNNETQQTFDAFRLQQAIAQLHPERMKDINAGRNESIELPLTLPDPLENPSAWIEALEQQGQLHGIQGIIRVWSVRKRENYRLPVEGRDADALWNTLFRAAVVERASEDHRELFKGVYEYALEMSSDTELSWPGLYTCVVGLWLRVQPSKAHTAHKELITAFDCRHVELRDLAMDCANSQDPILAIRAFRHIYKTFPQRNLYDAFVVPMLSDHHSERGKFDWHNFFVSRGDMPSPKVFALPAVQELFAKKMETPVLQPQPSENVAPQPTSTKFRAEDFAPLTRASMSALVGDVHGIKPKQISDSFVAKLLATWAFPLDFLVNGLGFLAIESLGPQGLRQLAIRCATCTVFEEKIAELKQLGIEPKDSNYARVMHYIAREGLENLFQTLLLSDQHPDTFEDRKVQTALLLAFLREDDAQNAHLTLIVLSSMNDRGNANAWNAVLRHNIYGLDKSAVESTTRRMRSLNIPLDLVNLKLFRTRMVGYRRRGHRPVHRPRTRPRVHPLNHLASLAMFALHNGTNVSPDFWIELLKRYGMEGDWKNAARLTMWLLHRYRLDKDHEWAAKCGLDNFDLACDFQAIFSGNMLCALVVWGFRAPDPRPQRQPSSGGPQSMDNSDGHLQPEPWARGLMLLRRIQLLSNIPAILSARKAVRQRMWIYFGPAYSRRRVNRETVRVKKLSLPRCVLHANQIFDGKLFPGIEDFLRRPQARNYLAVMSMLFGVIKSSDGRERIVPAPVGRLRYELIKRTRNFKSQPHHRKSMSINRHVRQGPRSPRRILR